MNIGSNSYVKSPNFFPMLIVALACLSTTGCGPSEKAKDSEKAQADTSISKASKGHGPTSLGTVSIGMSKSEYISALGINPINCNTYKNEKGEITIDELKYLHPQRKSLCWSSSNIFKKKGSIESIQVSGLQYDIIEADADTSKFVETVGHSSKALFVKDRLISLEIIFPNAGLETLKTKYGKPALIDNRDTEICKNRIGNEFKNEVGNLDAVWANGEVRAILRTKTSSPRETCSDGITIQYYILEESNQVASIEDAINKLRVDTSKKEAQDSPF